MAYRSKSSLSLPSWTGRIDDDSAAGDLHNEMDHVSRPGSSPSAIFGQRAKDPTAQLPPAWKLPPIEAFQGQLLKRKTGTFRKKWVEERFVVKNDVLIVCPIGRATSTAESGGSSPMDGQWPTSPPAMSGENGPAVEECIPLINLLEIKPSSGSDFSIVYNAAVKRGKIAKLELQCRARDEPNKTLWLNTLTRLRNEALAKPAPLGAFVDRAKAVKILISAHRDLRELALNSCVAYLQLLFTFKAKQDLRTAFHRIRGDQDQDGYNIDTGRSSLPGGNPSGRPSKSREKISPSSQSSAELMSDRRRGGTVRRELEESPQVSKVHRTLLFELRLSYLARRVKMRALYLLRMNAAAMSDDVTASSSIPSLSGGARNSARKTPRGDVGSGDVSIVDLNQSDVATRISAFMTLTWRSHAQAMAKATVSWRRRRLLGIFDGFYLRRLREGFDRLRFSAVLTRQKARQGQELLACVMFARQRVQLFEKRQIFDRWQRHTARLKHAEFILKDQLLKRLRSASSAAVKVWYFACIKQSALDATAVHKILTVARTARFKELTTVIHALQKHAATQRNNESLQVAANFSLTNSKVLASFNQIPRHRAALKTEAILTIMRRQRLSSAFRQLRFHCATKRLYLKAVEAFIGVMAALQSKYLLLKPLHSVAAYSRKMAVLSSKRELTTATLHRACAIVSSIFKTHRKAEESMGLYSLRRLVLHRNLSDERKNFYATQKEIIDRGNYTKAQLFGEKLILWYEKCTARRITIGWRSLRAAYESSHLVRSMARLHVTQRIVQIADRQRVVAVVWGWTKLKYFLLDRTCDMESRVKGARKALQDSDLKASVADARKQERLNLIVKWEAQDRESKPTTPELGFASDDEIPRSPVSENSTAAQVPQKVPEDDAATLLDLDAKTVLAGAAELDWPPLKQLCGRKQARPSQSPSLGPINVLASDRLSTDERLAFTDDIDASQTNLPQAESVVKLLEAADKYLDSGSSSSLSSGFNLGDRSEPRHGQRDNQRESPNPIPDATGPNKRQLGMMMNTPPMVQTPAVLQPQVIQNIPGRIFFEKAPLKNVPRTAPAVLDSGTSSPSLGLPNLKGGRRENPGEEIIDLDEINALLWDFAKFEEKKNCNHLFDSTDYVHNRRNYGSFISQVETNDDESYQNDYEILREYLDDELSKDSSAASFWPDSTRDESSDHNRMVACVRRVMDARRTSGRTEFVVTTSTAVSTKIATVLS